MIYVAEWSNLLSEIMARIPLTLSLLPLLVSAAPNLAQALAVPQNSGTSSPIIFTPSTQQPISDGVVTYEQLGGGRSIPFYPPLPPDSDDLVYDDGNYTGSSRNLQNAGINPGWPYWAHQVRFTPIAGMSGPLLQLRYVAAVQWGTTVDMDVAIRDSAGVEVASMTGLTAVIDTSNWQVVDVSSLNFVPGGADFYLELRPSNPCAGSNGFTVPFSTTGSGRSEFSSDCANTFASFAPENRDQFIRAVIATASPPTLSVSNLVAGQAALVEVRNATPNNRSHFAWSIHGGGPISTPFGDALLTPPYQLRLLQTDANGYASYTANVPVLAAGITVWCHGTDVGTQSMLNALMLVVQ